MKEHAGEDPARFLLHSKLEREKAGFVANQLAGRKEAREKYPSLLKYPQFVFPPHLNRQQSSSEATARYKASLLQEGLNIVDITGGFGIDDLFLAEKAKRVLRIEKEGPLNAIAEWNALQTGRREKVQSICADSMEWLCHTREHFDLLYVDPARRNEAGRKVASLADCTPNVLPLLPRLFEVADRLLVKASPMVDIKKATEELGCVDEVHVVEWKGECKEVLFLCGREERHHSTRRIFTIIGDEGDARVKKDYGVEEETVAVTVFATEMKRYVYEPSPAPMKAGCFKLLCWWYGVEKLAPATHLYTSDRCVADFPGRVFEVIRAVKPKEIKAVIPSGRANVLCRNYPVTSAALANQYNLKDSNSLTIVATTLAQHRCMWLCRSVFH
ncbi:MAG: class I SAM-dependent methyltransferase [Bacteroidales bacterium]|nr:class I SAM-dependent methyltransferase [Bacteroidales bacterium]